MGLPNVTIIVNRSGLGQIAYTNDSIMGLVLSGASVQGGVQAGTPTAIYGLADAEALGIEETGVNAAAWKQIKEFYDEAGSGQKMWFILSNSDLMSASVAGTSALARGLIEIGNGEIALVGLCRGKNP